MKKINGITQTQAYIFAKFIRQVFINQKKNNEWTLPEKDKILLVQQSLNMPWQIGAMYSLATYNKEEYNTISLPVNELQQFSTIKKIANYIMMLAIQKRFDQETLSNVYHHTYRFEVCKAQYNDNIDLIKNWHLKANNPDQTKYLIDATIMQLTKKLVPIARKIAKEQGDPLFDIDLLISNNNIQMVLASDGEEKYFNNSNDLINYCLMAEKVL